MVSKAHGGGQNPAVYQPVAERRRGRLVASLFAAVFLAAYQALLRPFLLGSCKFVPTCGRYAWEAVALHGVRRGGWLALRRVARCHPLSPGGIDLVPCECHEHGIAVRPATGGAPMD